MKALDVVGTALTNTLRSKMRTLLTVVAIVIGAFALTLTSGLGAGVNQYVSTVVEGYGDDDQMYVMAATDPSAQMPTGDGPAEFDPDRDTTSGEFGQAMLTDRDIETIEGLDHVRSVEPIVFTSVDFLEDDNGRQWQVSSLGFSIDAPGLELDAGRIPAPDAQELTVPNSWLESLDAATAEDAIGQAVTLAVSDVVGERHLVEAEIVGVSAPLPSGVGGTITPSTALSDALAEAQNTGLPAERQNTYIQAVATIDDMAANETAVKTALVENDMMGTTMEDQLGAVRGIIDAVTWVLNGFGLIALLAASFGIVNTLLMSVQERTREIGLMKALGMSNGKVFGLFSMEAVMIGLMGSVIGVGLGVVVGVIGNAALINGPLSGVAGLTLFAVQPFSLLWITLLILAIAFIAGTLPAARAARKDPIEALRHE